MAWVTCPHCGFTQIPSGKCTKCHKNLHRPGPHSDPPPAPAPAADSASPFSVPRQYLFVLAALALAIVAGILLWSRRYSVATEAAAPPAAARPEPWSLDLTGRWQARAATVLPGPPSRPGLREVFVETDRSGSIVAAGVVLTDPGRGGAGAGYLTVPDGRRRVGEAAGALAASPRGAALSLDFIPFPPWVPQRDRLWRALEGAGRNPEETSYLLLESVEPGYVVQGGVNASGFLSYLFLSPEYAARRGTEELSKIIHPGPGSTLRGFRNLVWDLSGAADFVRLEVPVTLSEPAGSPDRLVLRRQ